MTTVLQIQKKDLSPRSQNSDKSVYYGGSNSSPIDDSVKQNTENVKLTL